MSLAVKEDGYPVEDFAFYTAQSRGEGDLLLPTFTRGAEWITVTAGSVEFSFGTERVTAVAGDILYLPPMTVLSAYSVGGASIRRAVFDMSLVSEHLAEFDRELLTIFLIRKTHHYTRFYAGSRVTEQLSEAFDRLYNEWAMKEICFRLTVVAALSEMMAVTLRAFVDEEYLDDRTAYKNVLRLRPVMDYIEENKRKRIYIHELSVLTALSEDHFEKLFRATVGRTPFEYIQYVRMNEALCRLVATEDSVAKVASASGFSGGTYFARLFTEAMGVSPRDYRESAKPAKM